MVGVPLMMPVAGSSEIPGGSAPDAIAQEKGGVPPVTMIWPEYGTPTVAVLFTGQAREKSAGLRPTSIGDCVTSGAAAGSIKPISITACVLSGAAVSTTTVESSE